MVAAEASCDTATVGWEGVADGKDKWTMGPLKEEPAVGTDLAAAAKN